MNLGLVIQNFGDPSLRKFKKNRLYRQTLNSNSEEKVDYYVKLLNNDILNNELKEKIIIKTSAIIEDINNIDMVDTKNLLLKYSKIKPLWENILVIFEENENNLNDEVVEFLNTIQNAELLSKMRITTKVNQNNISIYGNLCNAIIHSSKLKIESYKLLTQSIPWWYESFESNKLTPEKIEVLINNNKVNPTINSFNYLRDNFKNTCILLLEKKFSKFQELMNQISIDSNDLELILKSKIIDINSKFGFVNKLNDEIIIENPENIRILIRILIDSEVNILSDSLIRKLLKSNISSIIDRITLFNKSLHIIDNNFINDFLISLGSNYELITDTSKKASIENNALHRRFLENLVKLGYISSISEVEKGLRVNHRRQE